jgi:hypothetical protein
MHPIVLHLEPTEHAEPLVIMIRRYGFVRALAGLREPLDTFLILCHIEVAAARRGNCLDVLRSAEKDILRRVDLSVNFVDLLV